MVFWLWFALGLLALPWVAVGLGLAALYLWLRWKYLGYLVRIFQEKPPFVVPRGEPTAAAEAVAFPAAGGLTLRGCYLPTPAAARKGVVLFGLEFGSDRWSCRGYCDGLRAAGYDVFAYEPRSQGESDTDPTYEPLQWVTDKDVADMRAALAYLRGRPDADPAGVGVFGVSKGGSTAFVAAAAEPGIRCLATDGAYATYTTMVPYMRRFIGIYSDRKALQRVLPGWFYGLVGVVGVKKVARNRGVTYPSVESAVGRLRRPLLMIQGAADTYIKPEMAAALHARAKGPKELWVVPKARHNGALAVAGDEYHARLVAFFDKHLAAAGS